MKPPKRPVGHPSLFTTEIGDAIRNRISDGESLRYGLSALLRSICQIPQMRASNSHFSDCADFAKKSLVFWVEFRFYDSVGFLNDLIECVGRTCAGLADKRRGMNSQFSMRDIGLAGFSPFF